MISNYAVAALVLLVGLASNSPTRAADVAGANFIKEAIQGNLAEVKMGELAQKQGSTQSVIDLGTKLASDHQTANQTATQVAHELNVEAPEAPDTKHAAEYNRLALLSGTDFDHQFVKSMMKEHNEDIAKYEKEAQQGGVAADYAKQVLPKLQENLQIAQDLEHSAKVAGGSPQGPMMR